ncbi:MAG TPA: hypothetical protein VJY35_14925 [Candidatus Eisenbacteria bacterium]|nr:hypothetical protein [Candidatus Eisenbacteria bacterium]
MTPATRLAMGVLAACAIAIPPRAARCDEAPADTVEVVAAVEAPVESEAAPARDAAPVRNAKGLEALVPELAEHPYRMPPGQRPFKHRLSFSPGYGMLGTKRLFAARFTYYPNTWLGYEWSIGHNPGQSVHAALHMVSAIVRRPFPGRLQPYASAGYGMMLVFPGQSLNAKPVTKNALTIGGGLEYYIRGDLAVRGDARHATVLGRERDRDGTVAYDYFVYTFGLSFYRTIRP